MEADETRHERVDREIEQLDDRLWSLAGDVCAGRDEESAAHLLTEPLEEAGFAVANRVAGLAGAITARHGEGRPGVALLLEYDGRPGAGLTAAAGLGAALATRRVTDGEPGSILVAGCPRDGIPALTAAGVFDDVDAALLFRPGAHSWSWAPLAARAEVRITVHGRAEHPPADAVAGLVQVFTAVAALQARLPAGSRAQGIITRGGESTESVPALAQARFGLSAPTTAALAKLLADVTACAEGAAIATGTKADIEHLGPGSSHFRDNPVLSNRFAAHLAARGILTTPPDLGTARGLSGIGDVSLKVPAIHPLVAIADPAHAGNSRGFAAATASPRARAVLHAAAAALGRTAVDLLAHPALVRQAWDCFADRARAERSGQEGS
ncbi:amidohydrolase [Amycolatopsis sp. FDAARGOS 1241]|uniref:amidohydrolase n=1 Tax=Amycolatopsis sp. FDAARGOS 1241 TaxID=2778070 RepID=UPI00194F061C|nr:amidohydrolase [Amycolatopsis sp. FDAARGOS 1241]QRP48823.1 amidohydrolase [Amycolatopsis sp. FDAARGOS 1241]